MMNTDWESLIQRHFDGVADAREAATLSEGLETDVNLRLIYLKMACVHALLGTESSKEPPLGIETTYISAIRMLPEMTNTKVAFRSRLLRLSATVVAVMVLIALVKSLSSEIELASPHLSGSSK